MKFHSNSVFDQENKYDLSDLFSENVYFNYRIGICLILKELFILF